MKKDIKDYLHLYLGCDMWEEGGHSYKLTAKELYSHLLMPRSIDAGKTKPILRPLSDMTEEEIIQMFILRGYGNIGYPHRTKIDGTFIQYEVTDPQNYHSDYQDIKTMYPAQFAYLLKQGFDLFGLIESGLAIDKTKIAETIK